ncbi:MULTISPECIES: hypothetical protein [Lysinibacillus]|uniref:hypothetical protein n=1 Tax=Lysinibacillus TaxID=400634 RepID=UPI0004D7F78F|nr:MULTISPECIES: hypothetical protein [Lysinibacillus]AJK89347.1 hypothetical protein HR49_20445 [Lysinibacillus fusiformis]KHK52214.1 hypothetical protein PI85_09690 [Lysinibacillus sp. A1]
MKYRFQYHTPEERENLIIGNKDKRLVGEENITEGNFLIFDDIEELIAVPRQRIESLETSQADQDEILMQLMIGGN